MSSYSQDLRERAVKLYITGDYTKKSLSELLSVSYKTLRAWIALYETTGSCKFAQSNKVGRKSLYEDKDAILAYLKLNLDSDGKELRNALAPHVAQSCFYKTLNRLGITYKKEVKYQKRCEAKRTEFVPKLADIEINRLVYIYETGVDNNISKLCGCAEKVCKYFIEALGFRTKRIIVS